MVVEVRWKASDSILVAGHQPAVDEKILFNKINRLIGCDNQIRPVERAPGNCKPSDSQCIPGGQLFFVSCRCDALHAFGKQRFLRGLNSLMRFVICESFTNSQVPLAFKVCWLIESKAPGENLIIFAEQVFHLIGCPKVIQAFFAF